MFRVLKTTSFRLSVLYGGVFALCVIILLVVNYRTATIALEDQIKTEIAEELHSLITEASNDGTTAIARDINDQVQLPGGSSSYYFLSDRNGKRLAGNLSEMRPFAGWQTAALNSTDLMKPSNRDVDHELWSQGTFLADGSFLMVGRDAFGVKMLQETILNSYAWSVGIAFVLAAGAGIAVSRRFLGRIDAINTTSLAIMEGQLKERIPVKGSSDEIDRLSMNLNRLFDSNQSLMESLKQVGTNIAHDLRTPLGRLRQGLEELRSGASSTSEPAISAAIAESDQLLEMFSALLRIAQIESGSRRANFKPVDLTAIFNRVAEGYRAVAEEEGQVFITALASEVHYHGDGELLLLMIANLLENSLRHTPSGTRIELSLDRMEKGLVGCIADNGPGIPADQRERVFERFYRLDSGRASAGNGLGLAMVAAIAELHGITVTLLDNAPGLNVVLEFKPTVSTS